MIDEILDRELLGVTLEAIVDVRTGRLVGYDARCHPPGWLPEARGRRFTGWRELTDEAFEVGRLLGLQHLAARLVIDTVVRRSLPPDLKVQLAIDPRLLSDGRFTLAGILRYARRRGAHPARLVACVSGAVDRVRALGGSCAPLGLEYAGAPLAEIRRIKPHVVRLTPGMTHEVHGDPRRLGLLSMLSVVARTEMIDVVAMDVADPRDIAALEGIGIHDLHMSRSARLGAARYRADGVPATSKPASRTSHSWHFGVIPA